MKRSFTYLFKCTTICTINTPKYLCIAFLCLCISISAKSQQPNFKFSALAGIYTSIAGSTVSTISAVNPSGIFPATNQGFQNGVKIGFPFVYDSSTYTTVNISTNGYITLGDGFGISTLANYYQNDLSFGPTPFTNTRPIIAPLWDNIDVQSDSNLTYITTGTAPNRVFTVQWQNVYWDYLNFNPTISFQVKLYETSNVVEFIYSPVGNLVGNYSGGASIGLTSKATGSGTFISLSDISANPSISYLVSTNTITSLPANGQTYRFTPLTPCGGILNAGTTVTNVSSICPYQYLSLGLNGQSLEGNLKYQWQTQVASNVWTDLINDTSIAVANAYLTENAQFRCSITCPTDLANKVYSVPVSITMNTTSCPPINDEVIGASSLIHGAYNITSVGTAFDLATATGSPEQSTFFNTQPTADLWYSFVATQDKAVVRLSNINVTSGVLGNIGFAFYSGTISNLVDGYGVKILLNGGAGESGIISGLTIGSTYYIRLATDGRWIATGNINVFHPDIDNAYFNSCYSIDLLSIDNTNNYGWQTLTNGNKLVADINPNGNLLGDINTNLFINNNNVRQDSKGVLYLDRNLGISLSVVPFSPVTVRFYFKSSEFNTLTSQNGSGISSIGSLVATMDSANCGDMLFANSELLKPLGSGVYDSAVYYVDILTPLPSISSYFLHGGNAALPVTFISFTAQNTPKGNVLIWTIKDGLNTKGFKIQHSIDRVNFKEISYETTSLATNRYSYTDIMPSAGNDYYRIKLEKSDGTFIYSAIKKVTTLLNNKFSLFELYPNPIEGGALNISLTAPDKALLKLQVTDVYGKSVSNATNSTAIGNNNYSMDLFSLAKGTYFLRLDYNNGEYITTKKFVKQ